MSHKPSEPAPQASVTKGDRRTGSSAGAGQATFAPNPTMAVEVIAYNRASRALRKEFDLLQCRVYAEPEQDENPAPLHDPALDALSFYICADDGRVISYAAVVSKIIRHGAHTFSITGLSHVMTDPDYQGRHLGSRTVAAATRCIERSSADIGIFTCDPPLAQFYERAGAWPVVSDVVLIGSRDEEALSSATLKKIVLMRLLSTKARAQASIFTNATIDLDLPVGQFL
ncbi:GNAT family N-acetyltransferase [Bradyrhizobium australafricanum]|uniref:GNAT family N-acetyltransferase n=1 Tax=Bradyrhizobium australafricanum TaxID=2821406 RepID=UPI001CE35C89|nr:GNAT family N-acetyltransferase [Bradyrhizobium australafricanum]MCA6102140.1 GNAT family N-acetyltransferase [Bradyrhizobium australafricanum]